MNQASNIMLPVIIMKANNITRKMVFSFPEDSCIEACENLLDVLNLFLPDNNWKIIDGFFVRDEEYVSHHWITNNEILIDPTASQFWDIKQDYLVLNKDNYLNKFYKEKPTFLK